MNINLLFAMENIYESSKLSYGGIMVFSGMATVFAVLVLIMFSLYGFKFFFHDLPNKRAAEVKQAPAPVEQVVEAPAVEPVAEPIVEKPIEAETPAMDDELSIVNSQLSANKPHRNAILSLYEEAPTVVGEQFRDNSTSVADMIASTTMGVASVAPIASLRGAIGVADKFMLVQDLFGGDDAAYDLAINTLDSLPSFDDCVIFISENYAWSPSSDGAKFMMELLQRKYNA